MKYLYYLLLLVYSGNVNAQQWCAPGAEWYHGYQDLFGSVGYINTHYAGDTLIDGFVAQTLEHTKFTHHIPSGTNFVEGPSQFHTTLIADVVYIWTGTMFDTLIQYSGVPGDQWQVTVPDGRGYETIINVTDTGHMTIDDQWLRYLAIGTGQNILVDTIFERIGPMYMYLDLFRSFWIEYAYGSLRCYSDDEMSYSRGG